MNGMGVKESVRQNIRKFREKLGISQRELADRLEVNHSTVAYWEIGKSSPNVETLAELCRIFNTTPAILMGVAQDGAAIDEQNAAFLALYWAAPEHRRMAIDLILKDDK